MTRMTQNIESKPAPDGANKKPRLAFAIATTLGLGYIPVAPGSFGAAVGCLVTVASVYLWLPILLLMTTRSIPMKWTSLLARWLDRLPTYGLGPDFWSGFLPSVTVLLSVGLLGVWSASRVAVYARGKDPEHIVIDEVSGQQLTLWLGLMPLFLPSTVVRNPDFVGRTFLFVNNLLNWKFLLLGFILFRVFDIWKPFPIRRLEKLPRGWGIMADDWMAGIYAAILLRVAVHFLST
jgi:phosphatidylglycerophosphatase A